MAKCRKGYVMRKGRCVLAGRNSNPFKPTDDLTKIFLWASVSLIILSALLGAGFLLFGSFNDTTTKILLTTLTLGLASFLSLSSGNSKNDIIRWAGISTAFIAGAMVLMFIWELIDPSEWSVRLTVIISIISFALAHWTLLSPSRTSRDMLVKTFFWITTGLIVSVAGMLIYAVLLEEPFDVGETFYRILGALAVLDVAGTITTPILRRFRG